jgi:drug/metabolite transporter (DMT)-like permease
MKLSKSQLAILAIIFANIIWGAAPPIFKWSLDSIQPFTLGFIRFYIASVLLLPFTWRHLKVARKDITLLLLISFVGVPVHIGIFLAGLQYAPSINVPIIGSAGPIFIIIASTFLFHERQRKKVILGTLVSLAGVLMIILRPVIEHGFDSAIIGNLFFLFSTFASIMHLFLLKKIMHAYSSLTITFWTFLIGSMFFLPMLLWEMSSPNFAFTVNFHSVIGVLYGGLLSSGLSWLLLAFAVKQLAASEIGIFTYIDPIVTALVAMPLLGEQITFSYLLGTVMVFLGIFLAEGRLHYHPIHKLKS